MLHQRLRPVINTYYNMIGLTPDYPKTLPHWPAGAANGCPCCGDAHCSYGTPAASAAAARQMGMEEAMVRMTEGAPTAGVDAAGTAGSAAAAGVVPAMVVVAVVASAAAVVAGAAAVAHQISIQNFM